MAKQHYIHINEKGRRRYPFGDMAIGDYLVDHDAALDYSSARAGNDTTPGREPWRWSRCAAYEAARSYHKTHRRDWFFSSRVELDPITGRAVGVRITCEDPVLRDTDSMLRYLASVSTSAWKEGKEIGLNVKAPRSIVLGRLREFTRQHLPPREHPLL